MTDIIPKASSGRYMGLSNVATASAGVLARGVGGTLMDLVGGPDRRAGPRAALWLAVVLFGLGALLLRPGRRAASRGRPAGAWRRGPAGSRQSATPQSDGRRASRRAAR